MSKILVIGSANQDIVANVNHLPVEGETILATKGEYHFGGKGANQAISCAKLGGDCAFIGKLGNDSFGNEYLKNLTANGVDQRGVIISEQANTGLAIITVDGQANNSIVVLPNANSELSFSEIMLHENLINDCEYILLQLEVPLDVVEKTIEYGYNKGKKVILNPAPMQKIKPEIIKMLYAITPNENEAYQLLGYCEAKDLQGANKIKKLAQVANQICKLGVKNVLVTVGSEGVLHSDKKQATHYKPYHVEAVDTTGAGDTFNGALVYYLSQGCSFSEAISHAQAAAALSTLRHGAQVAMPTGSDVEIFLSKQDVSEGMLISTSNE